MQALHFSFGLGAFVAPLLAAPFLEQTTSVLPTQIVSTVTTFQVSDLNRIEMERGERDVSQNGKNITGLIINVEPLNNSFLESSENVFKLSHPIVPEIPVNTVSNLQSAELRARDGRDTNESTVQPPATTHKMPKRKPSKTNASSLGNKNWDNVHVGALPKEDLEPIPSTTTASLSTDTSTTASSTRRTFPFPSPASESFSRQKQPLKPIANETITLVKEMNMVPSPIYKITNVTGPFGSINDGKDANYSKTVPPQPITVNSTTKPSTENVAKNIEQTENSLMRSNSMNFINVNGRTSTPAVDSINASGSTEGTVAEISLSSYLPSYSEVTASFSHSDSRKTQAYTISKIPAELELSVEKEIIVSNVESSVHVSKEDDNPQPHTQDTDRRVHEEHTIISSTEDSVFSPPDSHWIKKSDMLAASDALPPGNSLSRHIHHSKPVTYDNDTEEINSLFDIVANRIERYGFNKVQFTYLMVGLFVFTISLVFLGFLCHNPRDPKSKQDEGPGTKKISNRALHALLISLMAIFFLLYVGLEVTYGQLVLAFAVHGDLQLTQSTGLVIAVVFWGSFAAMRFASIFFSSGFRPITMLLLNFVFCTLGTVLLSTMASHTETALWVGTALLGIGLASVFPTGILWIERYIHVSNKVAAAFVTGASLGEIVCPIAVYRLMVNNPAMLMHSAVLINILCIVTFTALRWLALRHGEKYCVESNNGYHLASQEEEEMIDTSPSGSVGASRRHSFSSEHRALLNGNPHREP
jgi:fucose permease